MRGKSPPHLPETFILKANMQSSGQCIKVIKKKSETDFEKLKKQLHDWLKPENTLMNSLVTNYYKAKPMILAEEYIENIADQLYDYKWFCFDGLVYCCLFVKERFGSEGPLFAMYDKEWNKMDVQYEDHPSCDAEKPKHLEQMIEYAQVLSKGFPFIRVDFFDTDEKLYLAELTFDSSNEGFASFHPAEFDMTLGDLYKLSLDK
ncbi:MAG: hypothetical protein MJZ72_08490 [Bacteroidales bacterium]|nr:hypothetical protein [Bacteroidales bacterium]